MKDIIIRFEVENRSENGACWFVLLEERMRRDFSISGIVHIYPGLV